MCYDAVNLPFLSKTASWSRSLRMDSDPLELSVKGQIKVGFFQKKIAKHPQHCTFNDSLLVLHVACLYFH